MVNSWNRDAVDELITVAPDPHNTIMTVRLARGNFHGFRSLSKAANASCSLLKVSEGAITSFRW
jgi:hypothetical protein